MKSLLTAYRCESIQSHPSRGAWIEICTTAGAYCPGYVAPLTGCVD